MASIYQLKQKFQVVLRPAVAWLAPRTTPNQVTLAALGLSLAYSAILYFLSAHSAVWLGLPMVMLVRMGLNAIDGLLAREHDMQSVLGAYLNEVCDVVADFALFMSLAGLYQNQQLLLAVVAFLAVLTEFVGLAGQALVGVRCYDGPCGKSDRAFFVSVLGIATGIGLSVAPILNFLLGVLTASLVLTTVARVRHGLREASHA